jgi:hypothetical protein
MYGIVFWTIMAFSQGSMEEIGNAYPTAQDCRAALKDWYPYFFATHIVTFDCWPNRR